MATPLVKVLHRMQELFSNIVSALETMILFPSLFRERAAPATTTTATATTTTATTHWRRRTLDDLADEVDRLFSAPLSMRNMLVMSDKIRAQFRSCLRSSPVCMLPSYNHALPSGTEQGAFLAVDVGGSTFRVALVELLGHGRVNVVRELSSGIDNEVKSLEGERFFDWMAENVDSMLRQVDVTYGRHPSEPLSMGLSWSFPIEQTSINSGLVIHMGKGFRCSIGTVGQELGSLIVHACRRRNLNVQVDAIVNDSSSTLLSRAYVNPQTRMSLILGTGTNVAIHFPVHEIGLAKFGTHPPGWFDIAQNVIVNSEMSMFGGAGVLPMTRWDQILNRTHLRPDYQPLEYMITGRYLGEIVRLILVEAVDSANLFGGELPHSMREPYSLDTSLVAFIEADTSASLASSAALFQKQHTFPASPSAEDLHFLRRVCQTVSRRAAAYLATAIHSMWCLRNDVEFSHRVTSTISNNKSSEEITVVESEQQQQQGRNLAIACDGSVINKYPGFRDRCQAYLHQLTEQTNGASVASDAASGPSITLEPAPESAIVGAAVAVAVAVAEKAL